MKNIITVSLFMFLFFQINAQSLKIEHGVLLSSRMDSDDDLNFNVKGYGIEGGYYFLKKLNARSIISIDIRLAYAKSVRNYVNVVDRSDLSSFSDTIITLRTGTINYNNFSLAFPIKYRYLFSNKTPIFLLLGINPYLSLSNNSKWQFGEFEYNTSTNMNISQILNQEEEFDQKTFSQDIILLGFGYKKNKLMFDIYFSGGSTRFNNEFVGGMDKLSFVFNAYYRIN